MMTRNDQEKTPTPPIGLKYTHFSNTMLKYKNSEDTPPPQGGASYSELLTVTGFLPFDRQNPIFRAAFGGQSILMVYTNFRSYR